MKQKLTITAALAAIGCICLFGADPDWAFMWDNEQTNGPAKALRIDGNQITGEYRIDYSTNLVPKHWPQRQPDEGAPSPDDHGGITLDGTSYYSTLPDWVLPGSFAISTIDFSWQTHGATNVLFRDGEVRLETERENFTFTLSPAGLTNAINSLVSSGEFCRVRGHAWGQHIHTTAEYSPNKLGCRECKVCGLHQTQYATEWK